MEESVDVNKVLQNVVDTYKKEIASFLKAADQQEQSRQGRGGGYNRNSKGSGGGNNAARNVNRYSYSGLSRACFDPIPLEKAADTFVSLFDIANDFIDAESNSNFVGMIYEPATMVATKDLLLRMFVPYQLPQWQKQAPSKQEDSNVGAAGGKQRKKASKCVCVPPRVQFNMDQVKKLFRHFLSIPIPLESKMWKQIRYVLVPDNVTAKYKELAPVVAEVAAEGNISFAALTFCMYDEHLSKCLEPSVILQALYLGPLRASTVEQFASGRSAAQRRECREIVELAGKAKADQRAYDRHRPSNLSKDHPEYCTVQDYSYNATLMTNELKGVQKGFSAIPNGWACAALKKFGKRTYTEKTWREENLYDLIWTIMVQRPHLKKMIVETLERDFHDHGAAGYWRRMVPAQMDRIRIRNRNETQIDPLIKSVEFLNFPDCLKEVKFVNTTNDLQQITDLFLAEIAKNGSVVVGLDAEWSAFTGDSKATILQVAIRESVFIVDLEAHRTLPHVQLRMFFAQLFLNKNILKLGFQFSEDLLQMRNAVNNCKALHRPENLVCVGRMVADLLDMTEKRPDGDEILAEIVPLLKASRSEEATEAEEEEQQDQPMEVIDDSMAEPPAKRSDSPPTILVVEPEEGDLVIPSTPPTSNDETVIAMAVTSSSRPGGGGASKSASAESTANKTLNKGLSYMCEVVLGRPLDKTEQCSVWDRRPLRPLQTRYAAMDAYCMIMIYDVCCKWAERLSVSIDDVMKKQNPIRVSLPLFGDDEEEE